MLYLHQNTASEKMSFFDFPIYRLGQDNDLLLLAEQEYALTVYVSVEDYGQEEESLLTKILYATGNDIDQVRVVKMGQEDHLALCDSWKKETGLDIIFGLPPTQLMLQIDKIDYQLLKIADRTILYSQPLKDIAKDPGKKRLLWTALRRYFQL